MKNIFDAVLIERELSLTKQDVADILSVLPDGETFIPIEIEGTSSSAMGFITYEAANRIDFLLDKDHYFYRFVKNILEDMELENESCVYEMEEVKDTGAPLRILLTRDLPAAIKRLEEAEKTSASENEIVNDLTSRFAEKQKHGWHLCPRCGMDRMNRDASRNALSRRADIMICDICGNIEGIEDMPGNQPLSLDKWALIEHPERFFLKGKDYSSHYFTFGSWEGYPFRNAYVIVDAFSVDDAIWRFRRQWPDKHPGTFCFAFRYTDETWKTSENSKRLPCAGVLFLNGVFELAE